MAICAVYCAIVGKLIEVAGGHRLKSERTDIEAIEFGEEDVELLGEVQINEDDDWNLLDVFDSFNEEVPEARHYES